VTEIEYFIIIIIIGSFKIDQKLSS